MNTLRDTDEGRTSPLTGEGIDFSMNRHANAYPKEEHGRE